MDIDATENSHIDSLLVHYTNSEYVEYINTNTPKRDMMDMRTMCMSFSPRVGFTLQRITVSISGGCCGKLGNSYFFSSF